VFSRVGRDEGAGERWEVRGESIVQRRSPIPQSSRCWNSTSDPALSKSLTSVISLAEANAIQNLLSIHFFFLPEMCRQLTFCIKTGGKTPLDLTDNTAMFI